MGVFSRLGNVARTTAISGGVPEQNAREIVLRQPIAKSEKPENTSLPCELEDAQDITGCVDAVEFSFLLDEALEEAEAVGSETGVIFLNAGIAPEHIQRLARRLRAAGIRELIGVRSDHRFAIIFEGCGQTGLERKAEIIMDVCRSIGWSSWDQADERAPHIVTVHCSPYGQATAASIYVRADAIQKPDRTGGISSISFSDA